MKGQITITEWMQWKEDIRKKLQETANNFVYIGYRLRQIRDSGMLDGHEDIFSFAQSEYGLGKSTVSRFIAINEKFSKDGGSLEMREEFTTIGSSKLSEMLTLSDAECLLITEKTTVKEIRELKQFNKQVIDDIEELEEFEEIEDLEDIVPEDAEQKDVEEISYTVDEVMDDIEQIEQLEHVEQNIIENMAAVPKPTYTPLQKCIIDFFKEEKMAEILCKTMELLTEPCEANSKAAVELIVPTGNSTHKKGVIFLFLYDYQTGVKYKMWGVNEPYSMTWEEFLTEIIKIYKEYAMKDAVNDIKNTWKNYYNEKAEKVDKTLENTKQSGVVATSQQTPKIEEKSQEKEVKKEENPVVEVEEKEPVPVSFEEDIKEDGVKEENVTEIEETVHETTENVHESIENVTEIAEIVQNEEKVLPEYEEIPISETMSVVIKSEPVVSDDYHAAVEQAIKIADGEINCNLMNWENEWMPVEEIQKCIENTNELMKILHTILDLRWKHQLQVDNTGEEDE